MQRRQRTPAGAAPPLSPAPNAGLAFQEGLGYLPPFPRRATPSLVTGACPPRHRATVGLVSDARTVALGVLASFLASAPLLLFGTVGVAWSATAGLSVLCLALSRVALRRTRHATLPVLGLSEAHAGPNELVEAALDSATTDIDFWGVSATRTARSPSAREAMLRVAANGGTVRYLLMNPSGQALARRAVDEGERVEALANEIESTVTRLKSFADNNSVAIQVRYFDTYPIWRYVCLDRSRATVNWFLPRKPGHHSPFMLLTNTANGLFFPIQKSFEEAWANAKEA